jgi:hypothetical protein
VDAIEGVIGNIKGFIYSAGFVIGALPFLDIGTKLQWSVILTVFLLFISPNETSEFFGKLTARIFLSCMFLVVLGDCVSKLL